MPTPRKTKMTDSPEPEKQPRKKRDPNISKHTGKPKDPRYVRHPNVMANARKKPGVMEKIRVAGLKGAAASKAVGGRAGVPDGMTRAEALAVMERATNEAKEIIKVMVEKELITQDEASGNEALEFCVGVIRAQIHPLRERLAAAKTVLEFTKAKPVQKSEVTVNKAEDFLAALAAEAKGG